MIDADELRDQLTERNLQRLFRDLGFKLNGQSSNSDGWIGKVEGPRELGEGGKGNYAVNVRHGGYRDHGDDGDSGNIFQAAQRVKGLTFSEAVEWVAKEAGIEAEAQGWEIGEGREVTSYTYRLVSGEDHFEQVREAPPPDLDNPKRDKQFFPKVQGQIGSPDENDKIPYRLPEFSAALDGGPDFVTYHEGEKDADNARALGVPATTTPYGANSLQPEQVAKHFEGLHVAIFPDNDEEGQDHAEDVARTLLPVAKSVKIVQIEGRPKGGGDVSDWIEQKRSDGLKEKEIKAELMDAIEAAEPVDPSDLEKQSADGAPSDGDQAGDAPNVDTLADQSASETQAETLLRLAKPASLWKTPRGEKFATFPVEDHARTAPLRQKTFRQWLRRRFYKERGKPPGSQALQDAIDTLAAEAEYDGDIREAHLRVAGDANDEGRVCVDLGSEKWQCVEVTPDGWDVRSPRSSFRRVKSMKPLPHPLGADVSDPEGTLEQLRNHVRVKDDVNFALLLAWLVQALKPSGPYPILVLTGEQGSGKTTTAKIIRALVDPNHVPTRTAPRSEEDLLVAAENSWVLSFDNLSGMPNWLSDAFCRLATGGGFGTRKLYTNREEEVFYHQRPIVLNGIEDLTGRPDLADRALVIELDAIPEHKRTSEREVWTAFEKDRAHITAGLFSAVSTALGCLDHVDLDTLPRMADFAKWAEAAEPAFPVEPGTFQDAYAQNRQQANQTALESDEVARAVLALVRDAGEWHGKMSELCEDLKQYVVDPDNPPAELGHFNSLSSHLKRIMPVLRDAGVRREDDQAKRSRAFTLYLEGDEEDADEAPF